MRRILFSIGVMVGLSAVVLQSVRSQSEPAKQASAAGRLAQNEGKARPRANGSADEAAIQANIARFVKAYNAGDAKAVAALFTPDGQIVDKQGNVAESRDAIAKTFTRLFAEMPQKRLEVVVESIRFVGAELA